MYIIGSKFPSIEPLSLLRKILPTPLDDINFVGLLKDELGEYTYGFFAVGGLQCLVCVMNLGHIFVT